MVRNLVLGSFALIAAFWSFIFYDRSTEATQALRVRDDRIARLEMDNGQKSVRIEALDQAVESLEAEVSRLELARQLLQLDHRIAQIEVIRQGPATDGSGEVQTEVLFTELDPDGRLVLGQKLRDKIGLEGEAFFIASGDTFQIWKPETYDTEELTRSEAWLDDQPDDFDPLTLLDSTPSPGTD